MFPSACPHFRELSSNSFGQREIALKLKHIRREIEKKVQFPQGERKCFLCTGLGIYQAVNRRPRACPACEGGTLPECKETDFESYIAWSGEGCWWDHLLDC